MFLALRAYGEMLRFEILQKFGGFKRVHEDVRRMSVAAVQTDPEMIRRICEAVTLAACFFWKPVLCLPRSVVTTRMLRKYGIRAQMVIGYRPSPFFSHSWVEVDGKIVNDSPTYQERLLVLDRL
jgi:hypothetical protein